VAADVEAIQSHRVPGRRRVSSHADRQGPLFESWRSWDDVQAGLEGAVAPDVIARLHQAFSFALTCHAQQVRPAGEPYAEHLLEVLEILVAGAGLRNESTLLAGVLHDVVEDTDCTLEDVRSRFGAHVADLVGWLTKPDAESGRAAAARQSYLSRLEEAPGAAIDVKLADRLSNVQRLDTHPSPDKQRSYYRETVESILPLSSGRPWFATQFSQWRHVFSHLEAPQQEEG
jgi:guanosine-3',5'-bis(diphosphate) 3'-pyrophosphohydrolase